MSSPEDKNIDFEKLKLSEDLAGSLEPIDNGSPEQLPLDQEPQAEIKPEEMPVEEEEEAKHAESVVDEGAAVPAQSKYRGLLEKLTTADPYNVLLATAVAALLIAILCCLVELGRYGFDMGAKKARTSITMAAPLDSMKVERS